MSDATSKRIGSDPQRVDLVVKKGTVSGVHALFGRDADGTLWLEDLGSTNGTFVDGERISERVSVAVGTQISLGRSAVFVLSDEHVERLSDPPGPARPLLAGPATTPLADTPAPERSMTRQLSGADLQALRGGPAPSAAVEVPAAAPEPGAEADTAPLPANASVLTIGYDASNDVVVPNAVVSARHARLYKAGARFVLEDQGSTNGTWLRGERITRAELSQGDTFALGSYQMVLDDALCALLDRAVTAQRAALLNLAPGTTIRIGRAPENEVVLSAPMVSSLHVTLTVLQDASGYDVLDHGSTNGTFLNNRENRIERATSRADDVLFFGSYRFPLHRVPSLLRSPRGTSTQDISSGQRFLVGRGRGVDVQIDSPVISLRHAEVEVLGPDRFRLRDLGSSNGTFVDGERIRGAVEVDKSARVSLGSCEVELDEERGVVRREYHGDIMLQAERVSIEVRDPRYEGGSRRIVNDVSFTAYPTEFVGLMGPSGAGKTTLMMALNGYLLPSSGRSLINGDDLYANYNAYRGAIGYVPQDDIVFPQLTVGESLYYTARLRLPPDTTREEIDAKIERLLDQLEIAHTRDTRIGDAVKKGISGGERKRVNLAQELITEPSLLMLDEPTSGLASEDTINVMRLLRGLADEGRTVLLTIHQPSLEAYRLMDNVLYMFHGRLVYYGPAYPDSIVYFHGDVPAGAEREQLLADPGNALKPLAQDQRAALAGGEKHERATRLEEAVARRRGDYADSKYHREFVYDRAGSGDGAPPVAVSSKVQRADRRGSFRQWRILSARNALIQWKDRLNTGILLAQAPIIAAILSLVFAVGGDEAAYFERLARGPSALFLLVASAIWFGCSNSARAIVAEQAIYRRERMVNLAIGAYALSKASVLGVICALQCLLLLGIAYVPLQLSGSFAELYGVLLLSSLAGLGMGLTLSALVSSVEAATALVPLLLIPQIILGGVIMPIHEMLPATRGLASLTAARWGYEAALHAEFGDDDLSAVQEACEIPACVWGAGATGVSFTYYPGDPDDETESETRSGVEALSGGVIAPSAPFDDPLCHAFCPTVQGGDAITPLDRSFGADGQDPVRSAAVTAIADEGHAPDRVTLPTADQRAGWLTCLGALGAMIVFFLGLVIALLRARDIEVG